MRSLSIALLLLLCTQCNFTPCYYRPLCGVPDAWRDQLDQAWGDINIEWWQLFNDPVLNDLVLEAMACNQDLGIALGRVLEYAARYGITASELYPQVNLTGDANRTQISRAYFATTGAPRTFNTFDLYLNFSYQLDLWGRVRSATSASFHELLSQDDARRALLLTVVSSVAREYIQLRQLDKQMAISLATLKSRQESLRIAVLRFEGGISSELEVKQAESEVETAAAAVNRLETLIPHQENLLSVLVGRFPAAIERGRTLDDLPVPPVLPDSLPSDVLEQRPDLQQAEELIMAAGGRVGEARAHLFPDVDLVGYLGLQSSSLNDLFSADAGTWQYGATFLQPIFNAGRIQNEINAAQARRLQAIYTYRQAVLTAFKEVNDALIAHKNSLTLVAIERNRVKVLKDYLTLATLQYNNGHTDYLNVLDAERHLFEAQLQLASAEAEALSTVVSVYQAMGGGWAIDTRYFSQDEPECETE